MLFRSVLIDSGGVRFAEVDDDLTDSELREFSMESKSVVGKTKGDDFFGIDLEFDMEDFIITLEQDEAIGTNGFEGEFCGVEDGQGDLFPKDPTCEVLRELFGKSPTGAVKAHGDLNASDRVPSQMPIFYFGEDKKKFCGCLIAGLLGYRCQ